MPETTLHIIKREIQAEVDTELNLDVQNIGFYFNEQNHKKHDLK